MDRKFVPDEKAEKYAKIFGISTSDNDNEIDDTDDETLKELCGLCCRVRKRERHYARRQLCTQILPSDFCPRL